MTILLRMDDKMNRQLTCQISLDDTAIALSHELVHLGFINDVSSSVTNTRKNVIKNTLGLCVNDFLRHHLRTTPKQNETNKFFSIYMTNPER